MQTDITAPGLAVVLVRGDSASSDKTTIELLARVNRSTALYGILVLLPLTDHLRHDVILLA
ncbi:hypothetical protein [uncultured Paraglaciecola sp.]|uniref:hypothetical protein n=1 Tax=uncultured Paraglaciecola sp. TaxID=1765024 RepID=UPI0025E402D6|nr:hypothetical protein [uncultured Paraglaciecola sp.]